ncbi:MAG: D-alanyl-D-alanine carboxypeptidase family protein [Methyloceanibacter sp.]|nr:D-alanyl-D-alanine carboxypeptidase family protein [Methyloceanibacter sp.]
MLRRAFFCFIAVFSLLGPTAAKASPALVFEPYNGTVFYAEDPDTLWFPASLTKMMTAYVAFHALRNGEVTLDTPAIVTKNALSEPPTKLGLPVGTSMTLEKAIRVIIVKSANDVAVMVAETVGGTEEAFIDRMNEAAKRLGMTSTQFANPHGLPNAQQYTTARDLARLARALIIEFPEYSDIFAQKSVSVGKRQLRSHNGLLRTFNGADGMKTGFICDSGFNIIVSATRDGRKLVAVVLGEPSTRVRNARAAQLLENGFKRYFWKSLFGTSLNGLALPADRADKPAALRAVICGPRPKKRRRSELMPDPFRQERPVSQLAELPALPFPLN